MEKTFLIEDKSTGYLYYFIGVSNIDSNISTVITQYATISGKKISDNFYIEPKSVSFSILTSHIAAKNSVLKNDSNKLQELSVIDIKTLLRKWQSEGTLLNLTTFESRFSNMVITQLHTTEGDNLGMWNPSLTLTEVRQAQPEYVQLDFPKDAEEQADSAESQQLGMDNGVSAGDIGGAVGGAGGGALLGAAVGSIIPGIGTGIGAAIGAVAGFFINLFS